MAFFGDTGKVLRREFGRIRSNPVLVAIMVVLPIASFALFAIIFSRGVARDMPVAVVDMDGTTLSRQLVTMIDATPSVQVAYHLQDLIEGEGMIRRDKVYAVVYIPRGLEKNIYSSTRTGVEAYISGINITANGLIAKDMQTAVTTFSSGVQIKLLMSKGLSEQEAYAQMMPVKFDRHVLFNPYVNYGYYLLPSFLPMMLMVFSIMLAVYAIGSELRYSTAGMWFEAAGGSTAAALTGKMLPYTAAMFVMSIFMNTVMYRWLGVPLNGSDGLLIVAGLLFVLAYQAIGVLIVTVLGNLRLALSIGGGYSVLAFTFSGLTFPHMAMDPAVRAITYIFPFTFYTEIFVDQASRGAPPVYTLPMLALMSLFIILPMLCLPRLKKIATDSRYWGRL